MLLTALASLLATTAPAPAAGNYETPGADTAPVLPGIASVDPRTVVDVHAMPWRAVVRVQTAVGGRCTGFLVAPSVAITAAHCLFVFPTGHWLPPGSVHAVSGYDRGHYDAHAVARAVHVASGYNPLDEAETAGADWAVLSLDAPLGSPADVLRLAPSAPTTGTAVMLGGYGQDLSERLDADLHCSLIGYRIDGGDRPLLRHGCNATRGTSGAPLLARGPGGGWEVVGVQVEAERSGAGGIAAVLHLGAP